MIAAVSSAMGKFPTVAFGQIPHSRLNMESSDRMSGNTSAPRTWPRSIPSSLRIWSGTRNHSCNKNKRKESYRSCCNPFQPHTSLARHLLSFCELPPLFAGKFVHHFWIPAARLDIAHRGLVLHKVYSRYNKSAQNLSSLALPFLLMKAAMQPAQASKVSCTSSSSLIQKQHQTNSSQG